MKMNQQHLEKRDDGLTYEAGSDTPYTGYGSEFFTSYGKSDISVCDRHWFTVYENGRKEYQIRFSADRQRKVEIRWYESGQKSSEVRYVGQQEEYTYWYKNGQKREQGCYKNGLRQGTLLEWYENGQKECEVQFRNGEEYGVTLYWYENGNLSDRITHRKDGGWSQMVWHEDGRKHFFLESPSEERETVLLREWGGDGKIEIDEMRV